MSHLPRHAAQAHTACALTALAALVGCSLGPARRPEPAGPAPQRTKPQPRASAKSVEATVRILPARAVVRPDGFGPEILLPSADTADDEVARSGKLVIHKRHVFDRFLEREPARVRKVIEQMQLDALVARKARSFGITVHAASIDRMVREEEEQLAARVGRELAGRLTFEQYLERQTGMDSAEYRRWLRLYLGRRLYREYVLRYMALRQDRVQVRIIVHSDPKVLENIALRVRQGADFETLATRYSEDERTRRDGGLLPPLGKASDHPVAEIAFTLEPGRLSKVLARESAGKKRYFLVYCRRKMPGRLVPFEKVRAELDAAIRERPLTASEVDVAYRELRSEAAAESEAGKVPPAGRRR